MKYGLVFTLLVSLISCENFVSASPLIAAARQGNIPAIRALIKAGEDPDAPGGVNDWTPLMHAIHKNQAEAVVALADAGADVNRSTPKGTTALMMAAGYGQTEIVGALLARGAEIGLRDAGGRTALDFAKSGVADIDRWTLGHQQTSVVKLLQAYDEP